MARRKLMHTQNEGHIESLGYFYYDELEESKANITPYEQKVSNATIRIITDTQHDYKKDMIFENTATGDKYRIGSFTRKPLRTKGSKRTQTREYLYTIEAY